MDYSLPEPEYLAEMLAMMLGTAVSAGTVEQPLPLNGEELYIGTYADVEGDARCMIVLDRAGAVFTAAALSQAQVASARAALEADELSAELSSNLEHVLGVGWRFFGLKERHLKLTGLVRGSGALGPTAQLLLRNAPRRRDFQLTIGAYGSCRLTLLAS